MGRCGFPRAPAWALNWMKAGWAICMHGMWSPRGRTAMTPPTCDQFSRSSSMSDPGTSVGVPLSVYAYPWDLIDDSSAIELLSRMDVDRVVVAAAYHSVRAATPRHPRHR